MRPIQLTMTAFGPYKDREVIHFDDLEDHQLFVISGDTGSGKTTIFDGICFALYGSASGEDRENNDMLRSDFADDDVHTSVELIFEQHGRRFRILRQLGHRKEGNKTATGEKYEFFEIVDGQEVPFVDRQIVSEINDRIEQLIGLTQDQFKQIVMLPQGEFRKLLTSETENKEQILRRLFKTETYQKISDRIKNKRDEVEAEYKEVQRHENALIQHISARLPYRESSELFQVLQEEHFNINQLLQGLDQEIVFYEAQVEKDHKAYEQAYKQHNDQQAIYYEAKAINEKFAELNEKQKRLELLQSQKPLYEAKEKQMINAERASRIHMYEDQLQNCRKDQKEKQKAAEEAQRNAEKIKTKLREIKSKYEQEKQNEEKREEIRRQLDQLTQYVPTVKVIDHQKRILHEQQQKLTEQAKQLKKLREQIQHMKEENEKRYEKIRQNEKSLANEADKNKQLDDMRKKARTLKDYMTYKQDHQQLQKRLQKEKQIFTDIQNEYKALEREWLNDQAAILATHLHEGEPCPVCGSNHHPQKASDVEERVTKEQLDYAKDKLEQYEKRFQDIQVQERAKYATMKHQEEQVLEYDIDLDQIQEVYEKLTKKGIRLKQEVDELQERRKTLTKQKDDYEQQRKKIIQLDEQKEIQEKTYQEEKTSFETEQAVFNDRLQKIPKDYHTLSVLEEKITQVKKRKQAMDEAWENIQKQLQTAEQENAKAKSNISHTQKQLQEANEKMTEAEKQFFEALQKANFASIEAYETAKMTEEKREQLQKEIETYKQNIMTLTKQTDELKQFLTDKRKKDITSLQEQLEQLKTAYEKALQKRNASKNYLKEATELHESIMKTNQAVAKKEKQFAMITDLNNLVRGQNERRISFERYLQIDYLEQIIEAANSRLHHLSNGQFLLKRSERQEAYGRQSGLSLDVYDAYTGQTRDVKTLSGGEKFNASLCLALGMSDVIQSFQGNVAIDTMFIDEGFGSLDEESLDKAVEALVDLQETGRMIGVISHVPELKSIFPAVLQVEKTKEGHSQTKFLIK